MLLTTHSAWLLLCFLCSEYLSKEPYVCLTTGKGNNKNNNTKPTIGWIVYGMNPFTRFYAAIKTNCHAYATSSMQHCTRWLWVVTTEQPKPNANAAPRTALRFLCRFVAVEGALNVKPDGYHEEEQVRRTLTLRAYTMSWYWYWIWLTLMLSLSLLCCFMLCVSGYAQLRKRQSVRQLFLSDKEKLTPTHNCWCRSNPSNYSVYNNAFQSSLMQPFLVSMYEWDTRRLAIAFGCIVAGEVHALCTHTNCACVRCFLCSEPIWQLINAASIQLVAWKRLRRNNRRYRD